jgi:hypothetical protein
MRIERLRYAGPAPVTLEEFTYQVSVQKLTNELSDASNASARRWGN